MHPQPPTALVHATPATVLNDYAQLFAFAGLPAALDTALPLRIVPQRSRHYPFPAANTSPWQLDASLRALAQAGHTRICVWLPPPSPIEQLLGDDLDGLRPVAQAHGAAICTGAPSPDEAWLWLPAAQGAAHPPAALLARAQAARHGGPPVGVVLDATTIAPNAQPQIRNLLLASSDPLALLAAAQRSQPPLWSNHTPVLRQLQHYYWPAQHRRRFESWLRHTGWGQLFAAYQTHPTGHHPKTTSP